MPSLVYLNFDLHIERAGDVFNAYVLDAPAGQAAASFRFPFTDLELENYLLRLARASAPMPVRRVESPEMRAAKVFGGRLFESVFSGDVRAVWRASLDEAHRQNCGLRLRLFFDKAPDLGDLPWEYLYNASVNRFLALSTKTPLVRFLNLPESARPLRIKPPLRVLTVISSPVDFEPLGVHQERAKLDGALGDLQRRGLVALEFMPAATLAALQRHLRRKEYHILHFIGHGSFDSAAQDGELIFEDEQRRGRRVSGQDLGMLLHDHDSLRLAILNTCEGARSSRLDPFVGVAPSLVQQGIPAVIAMQFAISDEAAIVFAQEFYRALADDYPVDGALTEARKSIFAQDNELEWGTPVLYMRSPDGRLFNVQEEDDLSAPPVSASDAQVSGNATRLWRNPWLRHASKVALGVALACLCGMIFLLGNAWQVVLARIPSPTPVVIVIPPTETESSTPAPTDTPTKTLTASATATRTATATASPTATALPTKTHTATTTWTPTELPTATATATSTFTPTRFRTRVPSATPTDAFAPGVYVSGLRSDPEAPRSGDFVTFRATFVNTTGSVQTYTWLVQVFDAQSRKQFGETQSLTVVIPPGTQEIASASNWRLGVRVNDCSGLYARAYYILSGARFTFPAPTGEAATSNMYICP